MKQWSKKKKRVTGGLILLLVLVGAFSVFTVILIENSSKVTVYMDGENGSMGDEIIVNVKVSNLPEEYQASSFAITFDPNKMNLVEIEQGNIEISNKTTGEISYPNWQYDADAANQNGSVNAMYLDMTASEEPLRGMGFQKKKKDALFRMKFKILSTCSEGEKLPLTFTQATLASVDEDLTLSMQKENLNVKSFQIVVQG